jgi:hypothetical protein
MVGGVACAGSGHQASDPPFGAHRTAKLGVFQAVRIYGKILRKPFICRTFLVVLCQFSDTISAFLFSTIVYGSKYTHPDIAFVTTL